MAGEPTQISQFVCGHEILLMETTIGLSRVDIESNQFVVWEGDYTLTITLLIIIYTFTEFKFVYEKVSVVLSELSEGDDT